MRANAAQLTGFTFSAAYDKAIEAKQITEQAALQAANELEKNRLDVQKQIQQAEAEAAAAIVRANGEAKALKIRGEAWDQYLRTLGVDGVEQVLRSQQIENRKLEIDRWNGRAPTTWPV